MAERRMFAKTIIDSDAFLDLPEKSQLLYFHLGMRADDDGFINKVKSIMRICHCSDDDLQPLISKKFLILFDSGVAVIKHWRLHNYIRKDTYNGTKYKEEKDLLEFDENNAYRLPINKSSTHRQRAVNEPLTQDRLGKDRIIKDNNIYSSVEDEQEQEQQPEIYKNIISYLNEKAGKRFKPTIAKTRTVIKARLSEGFTFEDFKTVIDKKCVDWIGSDYEKYIRPETLFGTKFEGYLNESKTERSGNNGQASGNNGTVGKIGNYI